MEPKKTVLITGASSGMGLACAELFARRGWTVHAGARRVDRMAGLATLGVHVHALDVTNTESNRAFVDAALLAGQGRIDVLVNNAGYGEYGPVEDLPMERVRAQFDVNFFGAVELTKLVLPTMREQGSGRIVHISSIGGDLYTPLGAFYHATKAALQQFSDTLDAEVRSFGVRSTVVQPGGTQSEWSEIALSTAKQNTAPDSVYLPLAEAIDRLLSGQSASATSADLAEVFYRAATADHPKRRYLHSAGDRMAVWIARCLPNLYRSGIRLAIRRLIK
ncbi:MAG: SDR family NAD(P)-dependent oxidoreductase [Propionibacteriaceae bacterium]|jgi:NAD(P)-dependent dehydrogenase (short-subunit alcohol dehydrogenase family)|nr:SDR family NAD(P)-dependent oxidoreductase [Propionibacteriaceae bacterium]